jgi:hypothetical protein
MDTSKKRPGALALTLATCLAGAVSVASAHGPASASATLPESPSTAASQQWTAQAGVTVVSFDREALAGADLSIGEADFNTVHLPDAVACQIAIRRESDLTFSITAGSITEMISGRIHHVGNITLKTPTGELLFSDPVISPVTGDGSFSALWRIESPGVAGGFLMQRVKAGFDPLSQTLTVRSPQLQISPDLAAALGDPALADASLGGVTVRAAATWVGGAQPEFGAHPEPYGHEHAGGGARAEGCDMMFCQLYGHYMPNGSRLGDVVGLSVATTSWNVGTADCIWFPMPNEQKPFIVWNTYRLKDDRFEQIGMSDIKYGFYALGSQQCGGETCPSPPDCCHWEPGHGVGTWLGQDCTDTYSAQLNANQCGCGPRFEVNPWTGVWEYTGSHYQQFHTGGCHQHTGVDHRCQVHDADLDPDLNPGATYYSEGFYLMLDDVDVMNSAAWKPITVIPQEPNHWAFGMTGSSTPPITGFAIDAWTGSKQVMFAQEMPVEEFVSPDGRAILASKVKFLGGGMWHYEYALLNIDMDRQIGSLSIPIAPGTIVTNVGFHAVEHHGEPFNTKDPDAVPIDNAPWTSVVTDTAITWSTTTNPIRWNMLYNFRFDASAPDESLPVTVGLYRAGDPTVLEPRAAHAPSLACIGDIVQDNVVNVNDFLEMLGAWGPNPGHPADLNHDGIVNILDLLILLSVWGPCA